MATKKKAPFGGKPDEGKKMMAPLYGKDNEADGEDADGGGETEGEAMDEDNEMSKTKKSMAAEGLTEEELQKSLDRLSDLAADGSSVSRKDALLSKAQSSELTKSEKSELFGLLGGDVEADATPALSKSIESTFSENETLQKAVDVSDYLDENQKALVKSLGILADSIEADGTRQHEFNLVLAKAMSGVGKLVKGMSERLGVIEGQPTRGPKTRGIQPGQVLNKGFAGQPAQGEQLDQQEILEGLDTMMQKSMASGRGGFSEGNENILNATARFESTRQISPGLLSEVQKIVRAAPKH